MPTDSEFETRIRQNNSNQEFQQGKYNVIEQIGKGGMGTVYHAQDTLLKREVAIKEFSPESSSKIDPEIWKELNDAFVREATLLANLRHECLPTVFDFFTENYRNYLVMEFVQGDDLQKRAKELREKFDGQFPIHKVRRWAEDLLRVLSFLHDRESPIFHRDIKPANLKLRNDKICLLDFGLAKGSARNILSVNDKTLYGFTEGFAPLEQKYGEKTTVQTDIYGLSATLYYLLTGEIPLDPYMRKDALKYGKADPLRHLKNLRPEIDNAFAEIVMQGLAIEPAGRPRSASAMLGVLSANEKPLPDEPAPSPEPTPEPAPDPSFVSYNQTPLVDSNPNSSRRRKIIFAFVGGAVFFIFLVITFVVASFLIPPSANSNSNDNSNQPQSVTSNKEKRLAVEQKLYENPRSTSSPVGTLPKGAKIQEDFNRPDLAGTWHKIKSGSQEGWILCKKGENCFSE